MCAFKLDPEKLKEREEKAHQKVREKLTKKGIDLTGSIMVEASVDDGAFIYLLVFPDRVEYINDGKVSLMGKRGKGVEVIPITRISSVSTSKKLVFEWVHITTSGHTIDYKTDPKTAKLLKVKILELMSSSQATSSTPSQLGNSSQSASVSRVTKCLNCGSTELTARGAYVVCDFCQSKFSG